jgi:hypothetical protein
VSGATLVPQGLFFMKDQKQANASALAEKQRFSLAHHHLVHFSHHDGQWLFHPNCEHCQQRFAASDGRRQ